MLQLLHEIYSNLSRKRRLQLLAVLLLMLSGAVAEMFTIGAVVPFFGLLFSPSALRKHPYADSALTSLSLLVGGDVFLAATALFCVIAVFAAGLRLILNWTGQRYVFAVGADLAEDIYAVALKQPLLYHVSRNSAETVASVDKVGQLVMGVLVPFMQGAIALLMVSTIFAAMLFVNVSASLSAALVFGGMYFAINVKAKRVLSANGKVISDSATKKFKALQEGLGAIRDVILSRSYVEHVKQFAIADRAQRHAQAINAVLASAPKYVVESAGMVLIVLMAYAMTQRVGVEQTVATLGVLAIGAQRLLPYMQTLYGSYASIKGNLPAAQEVVALLSMRQTQLDFLDEASPAHQFSSVDTIELESVRFSYDDRRIVLDDVSFSIRKGDRVGLVGVTGGGKSTLIDILTGLLVPCSGVIKVNGCSMEGSLVAAWQRNIAYVPQNIFLVDASIEENIVLGVSGAIDPSRLECAIEAAQLRSVVESLPMGLRTRVGERGVQLSGGQRQRIGIARALYRRAALLVLDEATSALDTGTESRVMDAIYRLGEDMIIVMIAHRLTTLEKCNAIYEVKGGRVERLR